MNQELARQRQLAGDLDEEMNLTVGRLNTVQRKLGELLQTNGISFSI